VQRVFSPRDTARASAVLGDLVARDVFDAATSISFPNGLKFATKHDDPIRRVTFGSSGGVPEWRDLGVLSSFSGARDVLVEFRSGTIVVDDDAGTIGFEAGLKARIDTTEYIWDGSEWRITTAR